MSLEDRAERLATRALDGIVGAIERARADKLERAAYWYYFRAEQATHGPRWLRPMRRAQRRFARARWRAVMRSEGFTCPV